MRNLVKQQLVQQLMGAVRQITELNVSELPLPMFLGAMRRELVTRGFNGNDAELIASRVKVEVPPDLFTEAELAEIASCYATLLAMHRDALVAQGFHQPVTAIQEIARGMHLTCN